MPTMIILVLDDISKLDDVMLAWRRAGSRGITILQSSGAARLLAHKGVRDDLPLFPGLRFLAAHQEIHHRTLFTVLDDTVDLEAFFDATEAVTGKLDEPSTGVMLALPVTMVRGIQQRA